MTSFFLYTKFACEKNVFWKSVKINNFYFGWTLLSKEWFKFQNAANVLLLIAVKRITIKNSISRANEWIA